VGIVIPLLFQ